MLDLVPRRYQMHCCRFGRLGPLLDPSAEPTSPEVTSQLRSGLSEDPQRDCVQLSQALA